MGGGAMRTAAKAAGLGVMGGGLRGAGFTVVPPSSEQSMIRTAARPVSATISSASQSEIDGRVSFQRPAWELDDWEFAGGQDDLMSVGSGGGERFARVVFGAPPSIEEAKNATSELKDAIDNVILPSYKSSQDGDYAAIHPLASSLFSDSDSAESKACITREVQAVPKVTMQAFAFLSESPAAQSVVASVASDPNVWNAVMQNDSLMEFLKANQGSGTILQDSENENVEPSEENPSKDSGKQGNPVMEFMQDIKLKVAEMVNGVSGYIHNMFAPNSADGDGKAAPSFIGGTQTFLALAVMVIMVVVLKRG